MRQDCHKLENICQLRAKHIDVANFVAVKMKKELDTFGHFAKRPFVLHPASKNSTGCNIVQNFVKF